MRSQDEIAAIADAMNGGIVWNQAKSMFPESIYEDLTEEEQMDKAVERWIELCRRLGYTFKRSTFIGNMNRRLVMMVCKGERGEVRIKQSQWISFAHEYEHWNVAAYVGEDLALELEIPSYEGITKATYIIDMMCEYVGCARKVTRDAD